MLGDVLGLLILVTPFALALGAMLWLRGAARVGALFSVVVFGSFAIVVAAKAAETARMAATGSPGCGMEAGLAVFFGPIFMSVSVAAGTVAGIVLHYALLGLRTTAPIDQ